MWRRLISSPHAVWLTHGSLIVMTVAVFALLLRAPFWLLFVPGVILLHRIGVMIHEFIHGIPFRRYAHCLNVISFYDGILLMFGLFELFRGTHLSHHRWLNGPGDSGFDHRDAGTVSRHRVLGTLATLEITQHVKFYWEALHGKHPYVRATRLALGVGLSCLWIAAWIAMGRGDVVWKLMVLTIFTTSVPVSLRGAIEHNSEPGDAGFANEYRVLIPLFNLNRHVHHHEEPRLPWYRLEFRTAAPLHWRHYFLYWFRVYWKKDLVLMHPMRDPPTRAFQNSSGAGPVAGQPHLVLAASARVTGEGSAPGGAAPSGATRA